MNINLLGGSTASPSLRGCSSTSSPLRRPPRLLPLLNRGRCRRMAVVAVLGLQARSTPLRNAKNSGGVAGVGTRHPQLVRLRSPLVATPGEVAVEHPVANPMTSTSTVRVSILAGSM